MNQISTTNSPAPTAPGELLTFVLYNTIKRLRPQRLLLISNTGAFLSGREFDQGVLPVRIDDGSGLAHPDLRCRTDALPFESSSMNMVIANHLLSERGDNSFDEVQRVLSGAGQLIVVGKGRFGTSPGKEAHLPLDITSLCRNLKHRGFQIKQCEGYGLRGRPAHWTKRWQMRAFPLCDLILVRGELKRKTPMVTPLRFTQPQAAGARSTVLEGLNREAV